MQSSASRLEGITIFEQIFTAMNELLTEIGSSYNKASSEEKANLEDQLAMLRKMSDKFMEQWLDFEERLGEFQKTANLVPDPEDTGKNPEQSAQSEQMPEYVNEAFEKAEGYYKLYMFNHAITELHKFLEQYPEHLLAKLYLAMGYYRLGEDGDAYPLFQMILNLTEHKQLKAIAYIALGCMQLKRKNIQKAMDCFKQAFHSDPDCLTEPSGQYSTKCLASQRLP